MRTLPLLACLLLLVACGSKSYADVVKADVGTMQSILSRSCGGDGLCAAERTQDLGTAAKQARADLAGLSVPPDDATVDKEYRDVLDGLDAETSGGSLGSQGLDDQFLAEMASSLGAIRSSVK